MRVVGYVLVAVALACGPIGVRMQTTQAGSDSVCEGSEADLCEPASEARPELSTPARGVAAREDFIPLNTRGYNYSRPSSFRPQAPSTPAPGSRTLEP